MSVIQLLHGTPITSLGFRIFMQLSDKYEMKQVELKANIKALRQKQSKFGKQQTGRDHFILAVRRFMQMDYLTAPLLRELIDHINVYETEGTCKSHTQRIVIYYRFGCTKGTPPAMPGVK